MKSNFMKLTAVVAVLAILSGCSKQDSVATTTDKRIIAVKAQIIAPQQVQVTKTFTGSLEGERQAVLYAKISEAVEKVNVREGERIASGTILVSLDKNGPSSNYQQAKSVFQNSEKNYKKMEYLYKEGAVSESQYDAARTDYEVSKASFEAASQLVEIRTPIGGQVTSLDVSAGDFVATGQVLATVATTDKLRVKFGVNSEDIAFFKAGKEVYITAATAPDKAAGKVIAIANSADPMTRTFEVEVLVDNSKGYYSPGMFVRIDIIQEDLSGVIAVPRKAVLQLDNKQTVFVISGGKAVKRPVVLGPEVDGHIVVTSGLSVGDTLVILGQDYLDNGFAVNITQIIEGN